MLLRTFFSFLQIKGSVNRKQKMVRDVVEVHDAPMIRNNKAWLSSRTTLQK
jgi:hypothetical protein